MGIMGLWHGANWTFLIWGLYHAAIISIYRITQPKISKFPNWFKTLAGISLTLPIMMLSWIPFRASSLSDAFSMWSKLFNPFKYTWLGMRENTYLITFLVLIGFFLFTYLKKKYHQ